MKKAIASLPLVVFIAVLLGGCSSPERYPSEPLTPEEAIDDFQISDDFRVEIFAAEPHIVEPVDLAFDAHGRAYAVELRDFPYEADSGKGQSRIRLLEDTDGNGQVDQSTIFADGLTEATSILPWKDGLLVTAAPNILYLEDTNGDNKADVRDVLFTGFFTGNVEAQVTNLSFGVDNWIYASNAGNAGEIIFTDQPDSQPVSVRGGDFRFRLDQGRFGRAAGSAQFGQTFDDWGHRFISHNTVHVRNVILPEPYLSRNTALPSLEAEKNISDHSLRMFQLTPAPYWRAVRTERRNTRYEENNMDRTEHADDYFTGASGGTVYSGHTFPEAYQGNFFTAEIAGNLVHRDILKPEGATFIASRAPEEQDREFLASTDPWFRPTNFEVGPDGHLYLLDMYRKHVETPMSIPDDLEAEMDYSEGDAMGRIYRIVPRDAESSTVEFPVLATATTPELVEMLSHPNKWHRITAQRLLLERQDRSAVPMLQEVVAEVASPQARLHALYALEGLSALEAAHVETGLSDPHAGVREHAVRLAEQFPELLPQVKRVTGDSSSRVVFQSVLSLGVFPTSSVVDALSGVADEYGEDPWFQRALLSSRAGSSAEFLGALATDHSFFQSPSPAKRRLVEQVAEAIGGRGDNEEIASLLRIMSESEAAQDETWQVTGLSGLATGLEERDDDVADPETEALLSVWLDSTSDSLQAAAGEVAEHLRARR